MRIQCALIFSSVIAFCTVCSFTAKAAHAQGDSTAVQMLVVELKKELSLNKAAQAASNLSDVERKKLKDREEHLETQLKQLEKK